MKTIQYKHIVFTPRNINASLRYKKNKRKYKNKMSNIYNRKYFNNGEYITEAFVCLIKSLPNRMKEISRDIRN